MLLPSLSSATKDKETSEFRSLLQTVFSCLKSVLYCMVAFHTNRGLQAPVRFRLPDCSKVRPASFLQCLVRLFSESGNASCLLLQLSFPVKMWSVRAGDVRVVSRLVTFGLPALAFYEAIPHPSVDMREQFADLFTVLQVSCWLAT